MIAFSSFQWLLKHDKASLVATNTYVNPIVAMIVGIVFAHEQRSPAQVLGAFALIASVVAVWRVQMNSARQARQLAVPTFEGDLQPSV
jgi:drug/metabolite transporter (DMT)-like permease